MKKRYSKNTPWLMTRYANTFLIRAVELNAITGRNEFSTDEPLMRSDHEKLLAMGAAADAASRAFVEFGRAIVKLQVTPTTT